MLASSQLLGDHGAWADWIGYGPSTQPIGGLVHLWDYRDSSEPAGSTSIFPDHLAGRLLAISALAGLFRRFKTGRGGHASVAQAEAVANILGDQLLKEGVAPGTVVPRGNRSERGAPWGSYPCAGHDQWIAITVRDDEDWAKLRVAIGDPEWAKDARYATAAGRAADHDAIDAKLAEWTRARTPKTVTSTLQMFKVPSAPMYTARDQLHDPHFQARGYPRWIEQQVVGWMAMEGPCFQASGMSDVAIFQAPLVGEHTREIARDILGLSEAEIEAQDQGGGSRVAALSGGPVGIDDPARRGFTGKFGFTRDRLRVVPGLAPILKFEPRTPLRRAHSWRSACCTSTCRAVPKSRSWPPSEARRPSRSTCAPRR